MSASNWIHLEVEEILRDTGLALLVRLEDGEEIWLPRSVIADDTDYGEGDQDCIISVARWFAEKEELT